jgi:hypothetical protein
MTQQTSTITFDREEALAIIMALELVAENPGLTLLDLKVQGFLALRTTFA